MKKLIALTCILFLVLTAQAQVKTKLAFVPYTDPEFAIAEHRELAYKNIFETALRIFVNTQRFAVLDRGSFNILKIEKEFQKGEDLINSEIIAQGKILAAQVLAVAKISTLAINESDDGNGFSTYITVEFKQIDVETGKAVSACQLVGRCDDKQEVLGMTNKRRVGSAEEAISRAVKEMEKDLEIWIKNNFPLTMQILDANVGDMSIVADGGRLSGLNKNYKLMAVKVKVYPNGKKHNTPLAKLSLSKDGVGEETTELRVSSKEEWDKFLKAWKEDPTSIFVMEDLR